MNSKRTTPDPGVGRRKITNDDCRTIRRRAANGDSYYELARTFDVHPRTASHHARGACSHDNDVPPCTSAGGNCSTKIDAAACGEIRNRSDVNAADLATEYDVSKITIRKHRAGRCGHVPVTDEVPPIARTVLISAGGYSSKGSFHFHRKGRAEPVCGAANRTQYESSDRKWQVKDPAVLFADMDCCDDCAHIVPSEDQVEVGRRD